MTKMVKKYCVTALNPITGEREVVTPPCSRDTAMSIVSRERGKSHKKRTYKSPRVECYPPSNLFLNFNEQT